MFSSFIALIMGSTSVSCDARLLEWCVLRTSVMCSPAVVARECTKTVPGGVHEGFAKPTDGGNEKHVDDHGWLLKEDNIMLTTALSMYSTRTPMYASGRSWRSRSPGRS